MLSTLFPALAYASAFAGFLPCCCFGSLWGTILLVGLGGTAFWIWMLIDAVTNEPSEGNDKIIWILILVFTHLLGALIYFFVRRPERKRKFGQ